MTVAHREYFSPKEVANITGLSISTIRNLIRSGDLPAKKVGRRWLIYVNHIHQLVGVDSMGYEHGTN